MNKNTKRRQTSYRKACKKQGHFPTGGYKKKARPFPRPNPDDAMSLRDQSLWYHGASSPHAKRA